jgi:hypothetical protein
VGNILAMNRSAAKPSDSLPRRFILLPEDAADGAPSRPRIRRYQLTRIGRGAVRLRTSLSEAEIVTARMAVELGRLSSA